MSLIVYHKNGESFFTVKEYSFSSELMRVAKITSTSYSPNKLNFEVGAYVIYKNEKFSIFNRVTETKTARTSENIGDALKYDLEFFAPSKILETINFEDYVSFDDTQQYYTGSGVFDFYNNVNELAIRIQSNLDRFLGLNAWTVSVDDSVVLEESQVSVNNIKLSDGLNIAKDVFGLDYRISGKNIIIGGLGEEIDTTLYYGKNKGLYEINRSFDSETEIITRLKVYGAKKRNLPPDYLRDDDSRGRYYDQLMLPNFASTKIDYIDAPVEIIEEFGIREGSVVFEDIYPSIEEVDLGSGRIDEIFSVDEIDVDSDYFTIQTRDLGFDITKYWTAETPRLSIKGSNSDGNPSYLGGYEFDIIPSGTFGTNFKLLKNQSDSNILPDKVTTVRAGDRFVLLGIKMPETYITNAENRLLKRAQDYFLTDNNIELSYIIKPDEKFIEENRIGSYFKVGDRLKIEDDDLNVANYFTIRNISIKYGNILPEYDIKLSNVKEKTLIGEFQKTKIKQDNVNTFINNSVTNNRISNNTNISQIGEDLIWQ